MGRIGSLTLGIITAIGGFVDMGELVTCSQAGAQYHFALLWTVVVGVLGIMVYAEMAGRVAITSGRTLIDVIRERLGWRIASISMVVATLVNVLTIVIEISGMALVLQIVTGISYLWWLPVTALLIAGILWFSSFKLIENGASLLGLGILIFVVAAVKMNPPWSEVGRQLIIPSIPGGTGLSAYAFSAVSLIGAFMTPYEIYFYSSGAIEEEWTGKDFVTNRMTTIIGFTFGSLIVISMMVVAAQTFFLHGLKSASFGSIPVPVVSALGIGGLAVFAFGAFADTGGAALEASLSTGYSIAQFFGWDWGQEHNPRQAPAFVFTYLVAILVAVIIGLTGVDPIQLTIYTTALAAFSLPFTFIPLLIVANDEVYMGDMRNGFLANISSGFFLIILTIVTIATIPLFILSGGGGG
ncbi:MAG TPA: Nramp family divalent metal transporter [Chloroflexota bacterium]|nr:Nramp family divalent metal transporter [Chloroflexota bacterium]